MDVKSIYQKAYRIINRLVHEKHQAFIIYPYGIFGRIVRAVLNFDFGISTIYTANSFNEIQDIVQSISSLKENVIVLMPFEQNMSEEEKSDKRYELLKLFNLQQLIDIASPSMYFDKEMFEDNSHYSQPRKAFMESCSREIYANGIYGDVAECGVYEGDSAVILNELFPDRKLYLFDTFSGYDERDMTEQEYESWGDYMLFCRERFSHTPTLEDLYRRMPWRNQIQIIKGYFPETVLINKDVVSGSYALVNLDMNLYQPMKAGLEFFWNRLSPGGIILVDDIRHKGLPSARKAFLEFCETNHLGYSTITYNGMGMAAISKPRW